MAAYWAIGTYWGKAQSNNKKGHLIGHIKDIGYDPSQPTTRLYATHAAQPWHNDSSDQVGEHFRPLHRFIYTTALGARRSISETGVALGPQRYRRCYMRVVAGNQ